MLDVLFNEKSALDDFNIVLVKHTLTLPEPKTSYLEIQGADGNIDLSEVLCGEIKFKNRALTLEFTMLDDYSLFSDKLIEIANFLHGKIKKIILNNDENHYLMGRCSIDEFSSDKRIGKIVVRCDCEPWKYDINETVITKNINGTETIELFIDRKTICPTFKTSSQFMINDEFVINNSELQFINIQLKEGVNRLKLTGNGVISIIYRGGVL